MRLSLYFRDDVEEARGDAVAYLWNEALGPTDGVRVTTVDDYQVGVRDVMGGSNRHREITVVDGYETAVAIARMAQIMESSPTVLSPLGGEVWAVGALSMSGDYTDGLPDVWDLRESGTPIEIDGSVADQVNVEAVLTSGRTRIVEIRPERDPAPEF
jgi:hypothetical protein